jgi:DNA-binding LacI/PurR family transcriptional regulator
LETVPINPPWDHGGELEVTTISEVARRAGVGVGTVSRVLNGSTAVSDRTRRRVREVIDELGYEPHAAARALSTGRTGTIAVAAPFFTQPSVVERLRGVSRALSGAGYQLVLFDLTDPALFATLPAGGRFDGLLCVSACPGDADLARFEAAGVTVALVDCEHPELSGVAIDDVAGGQLAVEHLLTLGHRRIGFVGDDEAAAPWGFVSSARRRRGAQAAAAVAGAELLVRRGPHGREPARTLAAELLATREPPTAIFAASDLQALGVLEAAEAAGLTVPDELSVIGFDDIEIARYVGLTTVRDPLDRSGELGVRALLAAMAGAPRMAARLSLSLVQRTSTASRSTVPSQESCDPSARPDAGAVRPPRTG